MRKFVIGVTIGVATLAGTGASVFAGEVTGEGRGTPIISLEGPTENVGKFGVMPSPCAFSGLEDTLGPGSTQTPAGSKGAPGVECRGPATGAVKP